MIPEGLTLMVLIRGAVGAKAKVNHLCYTPLKFSARKRTI